MLSPFDDGSYVFIVRIRQEVREIPDAPPEWRGVIEHVPNGERRYFRNLNEMTAFIAHFVPGIGRSTLGQAEGEG